MAGGDTIVVNGRYVGLMGLDKEVRRLRAELGDDAPADEAASRLLERLSVRNYVPAGARSAYLEALARHWLKATGREDGAAQGGERGPLVIKILGPGCVSCNRLEEMVKDVLARLGLAADFEHITDHDEIWRYGVMQTPALVMDGRVLCAGRLPTPAQVEEWIRALTNGR